MSPRSPLRNAIEERSAAMKADLLARLRASQASSGKQRHFNLDKDQDGQGELETVPGSLGIGPSLGDAQQLFHSVDRVGNHRLDRHKFAAMMAHIEQCIAERCAEVQRLEDHIRRIVLRAKATVSSGQMMATQNAQGGLFHDTVPAVIRPGQAFSGMPM